MIISNYLLVEFSKSIAKNDSPYAVLKLKGIENEEVIQKTIDRNHCLVI